MKTIIFWAVVLTSCTADANSNYYNYRGTYEGSAIDLGNTTNYYNYRGDYMGTRIDMPSSRQPDNSYYEPEYVMPIPGSEAGNPFTPGIYLDDWE